MHKYITIIFLLGIIGCNTPSPSQNKEYKMAQYNVLQPQPSIPKYNQAKELSYFEKRIISDKQEFGDNHPILITDYNNLASFYQYTKDYNKALIFLEKSSKLSKKNFTKKPIEIAMSYKNIASIYQKMGGKYYSDSLKSLQKSLKFLNKEHPFRIKIYNTIGNMYYLMGDYPKALKYYKKSESNINTLKQMGLIYYNMGIYHKALEYYNKALKKGNLTPLDKSEIFSKKGMIFHADENYKKALYWHKKALVIGERYLDKKLLRKAKIYDDIGKTYYANQEYAKALDFFKEKSLPIKKSIFKNHPFIAESYDWIGLTYLMLNNKDKALKFLNDSLNINQAQLNKNHINIATNYQHIGLLLNGRKKFSKSFYFYRKSFDIFHININKNFMILDQQMKVDCKKRSKDFITNILNATELYKNSNSIEIVFNQWINFKRSIFDYENSLHILYQKTKQINIKESINTLFKSKRKLARLQQSIGSISNQAKLNQYNKNIKELEYNISKLEIELNINIKDINYKQLSKYLKPKELYIDFVKVEDSYYYFTLDNIENITFNKIDKEKTKKIELAIKAIQKDNEEDSRDLDIAQEKYGELYKLLIKPLSNELKNKDSLIISPDGLLNLVPFEAFFNKQVTEDKQYLIQKYTIKYIASGKEFVKLYENNYPSNQKSFVFGNADFNSTKRSSHRGNILNQLKEFSNLDYSLEEANKVHSVLSNSKLYIEKDATEENLMQIKQPKVWHISTHGFSLKNKDSLNSNPLLNCGIVLYGANESIRNHNQDGIVTGLELAGMDLKGTDLVVLSACLTGRGKIENSEGVASVSKAFRLAGAKYLVTTLWSIDDEMTVNLMEKFYKNIYNKMSYSKALQKAKVDLIMDKSNYHPYFWAGFVGSGRDN